LKRSLVESVRRRQGEGLMPLLSEIKLRSPKEGDLLRGRDPEELARTMSACPIAGLSVVTAGGGFGASVDVLRRVRPHVDVPILRKDLVFDEATIAETADAGGDVLLLTVAFMDDERLAHLHEATRAAGIETLVEVHDEAELERVRALGLEPDVISINNRDITAGETDEGDVSLTERLAAGVPEGSIVLSASAIAGPEDARRARDAGADAILVGTSILQSADPAAAINALVRTGWR
jgi:indole-3-glycerol phosphate synthase